MTTTPTSPGWAPCRLGLWGNFDGTSFGDQLAARVARRELARRLPAAEIVTYAPGTEARATAFDATEPALPLGEWSTGRAEELRSRLDCVVVTGARIGLGSSPFFLDADCWHAVRIDEDVDAAAAKPRDHLSVTDDDSLHRLAALGGPGPESVSVVPHPAVLAPRLFPPSLLEKRLAYLRLMGWYPPDGRPVLDDPAIALLRSVEDVVAAIAGSAGLVTASSALAAVALAFGRPHALAAADLPPAPDGSAVEHMQRQVDASFDHVAAVAAGRSGGGNASELREVLETLAALRQAHAAQSRRLLSERLVFADQAAALTGRVGQAEERLAEHTAVVEAQEGVIAVQKEALVRHQQALVDLSASAETQSAELERARAVFEQLQAHVRSLEAGLAEERAALAAIRASRSYRWAAAARAALARMRRL